jgi:hypothetical protein
MKNQPLPERDWKEKLNTSKITGHISGRKLIMISSKEEEGPYGENEYMFLDEWIENRISKAESAAEKRGREEMIKKIEQQFTPNNKFYYKKEFLAGVDACKTIIQSQ